MRLNEEKQERGVLTLATAFVLTSVILALGYGAFGFWTMMIFASGFLGGLAIWLIAPRAATFEDIRVPFSLSLGFFIVHRVEERFTGFFARLEVIMGVATPDILSWTVISLVILSVGAWVFVPFVMTRAPDFGRYLAWTFFTSMGVTELAHFLFPVASGDAYGYFPGMASVVLLAPAAWWGMWRLVKAGG